MRGEKFLDGTNRLRINHITRQDLEEVRNLHNQETILSQLSDNTFITPEMQQNWYSIVSKSKKSFRLVCRHKTNNALVGVLRIDNFDMLNKSAMIGLDVSEEFRRQGYAFEIYQYIINYFFNTKEFHRLYLSTLENNFIAINLYEKLGFQIEGRLIQSIFRHGKFVDSLCYYKLNQSIES
jgi:RimJ/RimL family protein N-acetyltransferase